MIVKIQPKKKSDEEEYKWVPTSSKELVNELDLALKEMKEQLHNLELSIECVAEAISWVKMFVKED